MYSGILISIQDFRLKYGYSLIDYWRKPFHLPGILKTLRFCPMLIKKWTFSRYMLDSLTETSKNWM